MLKLTQIKEVSLNKEDTIKKAMQLLDKSKFGFFIVKDKKNRLLGTVTDGDIRREMVTNGSNSNSNASKIMRSEILNFEFNPFLVPLYSNVTSLTCNHEKIKDLLIDQIISRVRWREMIEICLVCI